MVYLKKESVHEATRNCMIEAEKEIKGMYNTETTILGG